ncbi:MAG: MFS transporter [Aigarchaeota archaeon]|nr:MFS transporter [Aigarchaeota archaeon]MDW8092275.1 MFS transporter [Nitrososphaerota archaeon]
MRLDTGYRAILIIGLISLLGDFIYEGARSVLPSYMMTMGVGAALIGLVFGLAELAGWLSRPVGGFLSDRTRRYDVVMRAGYGLLIVVPLMGFVNELSLLVLLIFVERIARGIRAPARDASIVLLRKDVKLGTAFGIHELLDQLGAVLGPLTVTLMLLTFNDLRMPFYVLLAPYVTLLSVLMLLPVFRGGERERVDNKRLVTLPRARLAYLSLVTYLTATGLIPAPLLLYLVSLNSQGVGWLTPATYTVIMLTDAVAAVVLGRLFDKYEIKTLIPMMPLSVIPAVLMYGDVSSLVIAGVLIGVVIGAHESVFRSAVALLVDRSGLGAAYGILGTAYGGGALTAGVVFGYFVDVSLGLPIVLLYALLLQTSASIILWRKVIR